MPRLVRGRKENAMKNIKTAIAIVTALLLVFLLVVPTFACSIDFGAAQDSANQAAGQIIQTRPFWLQEWLYTVFRDLWGWM